MRREALIRGSMIEETCAAGGEGRKKRKKPGPRGRIDV